MSQMGQTRLLCDVGLNVRIGTSPPFAERHLWNVVSSKPDHSGLMPATLISLAHFSVSVAMCLPDYSGEPGSTVPPRSASRAFILSSARAALICAQQRSTSSTARPSRLPIRPQRCASLRVTCNKGRVKHNQGIARPSPGRPFYVSIACRTGHDYSSLSYAYLG
jgi:hypothetical protein